MLVLNKLLPLLVSPLFVFMLWALLALLFKRAQWIWPALALLGLSAMPWTAHQLVRTVEQDAVLLDPATMPQADAIVLLSGMVRTVPAAGEQLRREWHDGVDRFEGALALWRAGRAPRLLITAGRQPWDLGNDTEGHWLREQALARGVPAAAVELTPEVENTAAEAGAVRALMPGAHILLVTSAFHMPRARAEFEAAGLQITPFPVDLRVGLRTFSPQDLVPNADALAQTSMALREWMGRAFYSLKRLLGRG